MRIRRIKVHNYAGITQAEVSFPNEGITIVQGPNEAGKTSLIEAVDLILDLQDSSNHRRVKEVIPVGKDVGPEVEIDMTAGVYEFTYSKRWKR
ncbi:MAG: AAA family ATPase, partial [Actinobacteria bacterium]|nr:AAA family ATPase [Actinomycetota bacterium]